jgi:hypothetical protein
LADNSPYDYVHRAALAPVPKVAHRGQYDAAGVLHIQLAEEQRDVNHAAAYSPRPLVRPRIRNPDRVADNRTFVQPHSCRYFTAFSFVIEMATR